MKQLRKYQDPQRNAFWLVICKKKPPKSMAPLGVLVHLSIALLLQMSEKMGMATMQLSWEPQKVSSSVWVFSFFLFRFFFLGGAAWWSSFFFFFGGGGCFEFGFSFALGFWLLIVVEYFQMNRWLCGGSGFCKFPCSVETSPVQEISALLKDSGDTKRPVFPTKDLRLRTTGRSQQPTP